MGGITEDFYICVNCNESVDADGNVITDEEDAAPEEAKEKVTLVVEEDNNEKKLEKAFSIIDLEVEQKEAKLRKEQLKENFELLKQMNNSKLIELYNSYGINDSESLIKYLRKNIEFGVNVKINDEMVKIPFGALESTEGKNNIKITYDNPEIIAFLNKYYLKNKEEINPLGLDVTQMLKNISASTDIINKYYVINYPHDMFKNEVGNSIEQMEFMALFFEVMGMPVKRYALSQITDYNGKIIFNDTHYFMCFNENGIWKWPENALTDFRGIYEYNSLEAFIDIAVSKMIYNKELNPEKQLDEKTLKEILALDWNYSAGIGLVLGYNNFRALDVDIDSDFMFQVMYQSGAIDDFIDEIAGLIE